MAESKFDEIDYPGQEPGEIKVAEVQPKETAQQKALVSLGENGLPTPKNMEEEFRVAEALFKGGGLPQWVKNSVQAFVAAQYSRALGFQPIVGVQFMQLVNGRISLWGEGPLAAVRNSGKLEWISEYIIDEKYRRICTENKNLDADIFAAVCRVKRIGSPEMKESTFTAKDADQVKHGIEDIWKKWRPIMMKRKCRAMALKDEFGDVLLGTPISEYNFHTAPDFPEQKQISLAERLNARTNEKPGATQENQEADVLGGGMPGNGEGPVPRNAVCSSPM